jgi:hypothetical protein
VKLHEFIRFSRSASYYAKPDNAKRFAQHVVPQVIRPAQIIWNQAIGALFLLLAAVGAVQIYRAVHYDSKNGLGLGLPVIFFAVMMFFAVTSFLKARRIAARIPRQ